MKFIVLFLMAISLLFASVDINNADAKSLTELNGVGPKKSEAIVKYRDANGCFLSIDSLKKVKGIGPKTVAKNRDDIILGKCRE